MFESLKTLFLEANSNFLKEDMHLISANVSERCLCGALQCHIRDLLLKSSFKDYFVDVEYNRNGRKDKLGCCKKTIQGLDQEVITIVCDLIVHSRGKNLGQDNLLAIEMKKSYRSADKKKNDKNRLICLTKDSFDNVWSFDGNTLPEHVCRYVIGIYYEINLKQRQIELEYYAKGGFVEKETIPF